MQVLVVVVNQPRYVVPILDRLAEMGVTGATVIDSMGMAALIADHVPFFSRFAGMNGERHHNKTLFTVLHDDQVEMVADAIDHILGGLERPESGFLFSLPVALCRGLAACDRKTGGE